MSYVKGNFLAVVHIGPALSPAYNGIPALIGREAGGAEVRMAPLLVLG